MKDNRNVNVIVGLIVILFAIFCPSIIAEIHSVTWRVVIGLLGCFSLVSGMYKIVIKKIKSSLV